jgi:hypothetical protein
MIYYLCIRNAIINIFLMHIILMLFSSKAKSG